MTKLEALKKLIKKLGGNIDGANTISKAIEKINDCELGGGVQLE